jgi:hypothetical protein
MPRQPSGWPRRYGASIRLCRIALGGIHFRRIKIKIGTKRRCLKIAIPAKLRQRLFIFNQNSKTSA